MKSQKYINSWMDFGNNQYGIPFDSQDLTIALAKAQEYAEGNGRVAALPDIVNARLLSPRRGLAWGAYDSTSFEYAGKSPQGNLVYVVAHSVGPLMSPSRIKRAIAQKQLGDRLSQEGSVLLSNKEFRDLLGGRFGKIKVFDFNTILNLPYPSDTLSIERAKNNPLVRARLGKNVDDYLDLVKRNCPDIDGNSECYSSAGINLEMLNTNYLTGERKFTFKEPEGAILSIGNLITRELGYTDISIHGFSSGSFIGINDLKKKEEFIKILSQPVTTNLSGLFEFVKSVVGVSASREIDFLELIKKNFNIK